MLWLNLLDGKPRSRSVPSKTKNVPRVGEALSASGQVRRVCVLHSSTHPFPSAHEERESSHPSIWPSTKRSTRRGGWFISCVGLLLQLRSQDQSDRKVIVPIVVLQCFLEKRNSGDSCSVSRTSRSFMRQIGVCEYVVFPSAADFLDSSVDYWYDNDCGK